MRKIFEIECDDDNLLEEGTLEDLLHGLLSAPSTLTFMVKEVKESQRRHPEVIDWIGEA